MDSPLIYLRIRGGLLPLIHGGFVFDEWDSGGNDDYEKDFRGSSGEGRRGQGRTTGTGPISIRREEPQGFPFRQPNDDYHWDIYESTSGPP